MKIYGHSVDIFRGTQWTYLGALSGNIWALSGNIGALIGNI